MNFKILYLDEQVVAIHKPAGFYVHPPEDGQHRISHQVNCLYLLRKQIGKYLYPVHRLDRATSGVLIFALTPESARLLSGWFHSQSEAERVRKTYYCVTRGWVPESGTIDYALKENLVSGNEEVFKPAITHFRRVATTEIQQAVGRYSTARYSLVEVVPITGRTHQIRRHFAHISHPLVGDTIYGDGAHNRFFREFFQLRRLFLCAYALQLPPSPLLLPLLLRTDWTKDWHHIFEQFGICPRLLDYMYSTAIVRSP
jgi:tRNA pseudouridine65 synthase